MFARSLLRVAAIPALAAIILGIGGGSASAAPVPFGGNSYDFVLDDQLTWPAARDAASTAGGSLAVISSAEEQAFIDGLLLGRNAPTGSYWIGIEETAAEGVYSPIDATILSFSNFSTAEPNDAGGLGESVGAIYWTEDGGDPATLPRRGEWNDLPQQGYPNDGALVPAQADLFRAGYLLEFADARPDVRDGDDGGNPNAIPIPTALLTFPTTALLAILAARRMRR